MKVSSCTKRLSLFFAFNFLVLNLILIFAGTSWHETVFFETFIFVHRAANIYLERPVQQAADSWDPMLRGLDYQLTPHESPLYTQIFFQERIKFQYPPTSLLFIYPVRLLTRDATAVLDWISWIFVLAISVLIAHLGLQWIDKQPENTAAGKHDRVIRFLILMLYSLTFYPLMKGLSLGQIQTWISLLITLLVFAWWKNKEIPAGICGALIALIKPQYLLLLFWGLLRRKTSFVLTFAITAGVGLCLSLVLFGFEPLWNYFGVLQFLSEHGEAYRANQSVNGLLHRLFLNGEILTFEKFSFPPFHQAVYQGTLLSSIVLVLLAIRRPQHAGTASGNLPDLAIIVLTITIASPIAWEHHYAALLPIFAMLIAFPLQRPQKLLLLGAYVFASNYFAFTKHFSYTAGANLIQSYLLVSGLLVLTILYRVRSQACPDLIPCIGEEHRI